MRPNGEELFRGVQASLISYVLPEVQSAYVRQELTAALALLGIAANEWDGAAQRLADENRELRELAGRAGGVLADVPDAQELAGALHSLAAEADASLRLSDLSTANAALRDAIARGGVVLEGRDAPALRELESELIDWLRRDAEGRALGLLGPRADG